MKKILVIEDEQAVSDSILDILNSEDFNAISAENGRVGIQLASEFQPNLILCDVMMPELDGYGVLTQMRQNVETATIPFIFLTAKSDPTDFRQGMALGADDYVTKPFTHSELLQAITTRLGKQATVEEQSQEKLDELRQSISFSLPKELGTALSAITEMSQMLIEDYASVPSDEILETAEGINANAKRLHRLVQNSLLMAKLEGLATNPAQLALLQREKLDHTTMIIAAIATAKAAQYHREADLTLELSPVSVQISEIKLKKITEELVDNAFKFSAAKSEVRVFSACHQDRFVLHVVDYGHGMTAEQITKIGAYMQFDREQLEQPGSGLGLAIAKRLTEIHHGQFIIESIPGAQTLVRVSIPCWD